MDNKEQLGQVQKSIKVLKTEKEYWENTLRSFPKEFATVKVNEVHDIGNLKFLIDCIKNRISDCAEILKEKEIELESLKRQGIPDISEATLLTAEQAEFLLTEKDRKYKDYWWLRTPGKETYNAADVSWDGEISLFGSNTYYSDDVVRPALVLKDLNGLIVGETFMFGGKPFKIISNSLAFCLGDIGKHYFRQDCEAADANIYEKSDVKRYIDFWFEKSKEEEEQKNA